MFEFAADNANIVIRGVFDEGQLTPRFLLDQDLITQSDFEKTEFELKVPEVLIYQADWIRCQIRREAIELTCTDPVDFERLRDVAIGILGSLPGIRASLLGINRVVHFVVPDWDSWHRIGDRLANNALWHGVLDLPGMRSLTTIGSRPDLYWGHVQVQVEPSNQYERAIFVAVNDHFDLTTVDAQPSSREEALALERVDDKSASVEKSRVAIGILSDEWGASMKRSSTIISHIAKQAAE